MKKFVLWLVTLSLVFSICSVPAFATEPPVTEPKDTVEPRTDEAIWITRTYNGKLQKRLWSTTYGIWLTDWIDVE